MRPRRSRHRLEDGRRVGRVGCLKTPSLAAIEFVPAIPLSRFLRDPELEKY